MSLHFHLTARRGVLFPALGAFTLFAALCLSPVAAQTDDSAAAAADAAAAPAAVSETIQVVATRVPEAVEPVPAAITVISGDELRARGADDLPSALALVAGISIGPGGDGGPASAVPEIWGLREFDAFLL
ncbi:MAG: Plug domain-containing protein, partial [Thermoanaerobaculia bacterium]